MRKSLPYEVYDQLSFKVPLGVLGDCYDRYLVRIQEMRESLNLMQQCIENIPAGTVKVSDTKFTSPSRGEAKDSMEGLIHHFK